MREGSRQDALWQQSIYLIFFSNRLTVKPWTYLLVYNIMSGRVCVCVCVCVWKRERERESEVMMYGIGLNYRVACVWSPVSVDLFAIWTHYFQLITQINLHLFCDRFIWKELLHFYISKISQLKSTGIFPRSWL